MVSPPIMRRQRPGIRAQQTTITLPSDEMERLRKEAFKAGTSVSMHIIALIRQAWAQDGEKAA